MEVACHSEFMQQSGTILNDALFHVCVKSIEIGCIAARNLVFSYIVDTVEFSGDEFLRVRPYAIWMGKVETFLENPNEQPPKNEEN